MVDKAINTNLDMLSVSRILNLPNAVLAQEPATLGQALALVNGMNHKKVRVASTASISIAAPGATIDGITMVIDDRFLEKDNSTATSRGIYVWNGAATPATRATDADLFVEMEAAVIRVEEGTSNGGTGWRQTAVNGVIGTNAFVFISDQTTVPAASETTSGIAELATQAETDAGTDDLRIVTPLKLKTASFVPKKYTQTFGDGAAVSYVITHNLNNIGAHAVVYVTATGAEVEVAIDTRSANALTIKTNVAPTAAQYTVSIVG